MFNDQAIRITLPGDLLRFYFLHSNWKARMGVFTTGGVK